MKKIKMGLGIIAAHIVAVASTGVRSKEQEPTTYNPSVRSLDDPQYLDTKGEPTTDVTSELNPYGTHTKPTGVEKALYEAFGYDTNKLSVQEIQALEEQKLREDPMYGEVKEQITKQLDSLGLDRVKIELQESDPLIKSPQSFLSLRESRYQTALHRIVEEADKKADPISMHDVNLQAILYAQIVRVAAKDLGYRPPTE